MMRLPAFSYVAPRTIDDAVRTLAGGGPHAMLVAGGTDLYPNMKRRQQNPRVVIGLRGIPELSGITGSPKTGLSVGACTTLADLSTHRAVLESHPALSRAVRTISTPILRNMGTIGGNICLDTRCNYYDQNYEWRRAINFCMKCEGETCWVAPSSRTCLAVNSSDSVPLLCAIGATVRLAGTHGPREIAMRDFYNKDGIRYINKQPDEIVTHIDLPPVDGWSATYHKLARRGSFDFPVLGVAVAMWRGPDGTILDARIYLNAVASAPVEAAEAREALIGHKPTPDLIAHASHLASLNAKPMDNTDLDYAWRKKMVRVYVERALNDLS